jgi:DNA-binding MarR family transcriptional regulator
MLGQDRAAVFSKGAASGGPPDPSGATTPSPPFAAVGFLLSTLGFAVSRRFSAALAPFELEPPEFGLLRALAFSEGLSQQALAQRIQIQPSRMVAIVDGLERRELIERRANPRDRRAHALYLTAAGRDKLTQALQAAIGFEQSLCAELSGAEREQLVAILKRIAATLELPSHAHSALADAAPGR